jgi:hypothetical protein
MASKGYSKGAYNKGAWQGTTAKGAYGKNAYSKSGKTTKGAKPTKGVSQGSWTWGEEYTQATPEWGFEEWHQPAPALRRLKVGNQFAKSILPGTESPAVPQGVHVERMWRLRALLLRHIVQVSLECFFTSSEVRPSEHQDKFFL